MSANKKVIYTVITNHYDRLFPPLVEQEGWDMVCFSDDAQLVAEGWQVRPLPPLPELESVKDDPVRAARLVKILPHRFLQEYEYSLYIDGNRVLADSADRFVQGGNEELLCLQGLFVDPYAAADRLLQHEEEAEEDELALSQRKALSAAEKKALKDAAGRWKKGKLPEYCGCPGTALLGRRHNEKAVAALMETWAGEVLQGLVFDELALPYACHTHGMQWAERLNQIRQEGWLFSEAEQLAPAMQHVRIGEAEASIEKVEYEKNPPPPGGEYDGYPYLLTIGVPVSNQIGTIRRCLDGIKPILDALPSELLVVDTGSTDGTVEVCREYGARVVEFPWINDMSAARNTGIRAAKGSWFMSIDDDEWFEDTSEIIRFFKSGLYKKFNMGLYNQRNYLNKNMTNVSEFPTPRLGKLTPELHFEGRIHDALMQEKPLKQAYISSVANHLGFAQDDKEAARAKVRRNVMILKREVVEHPEDMRFANQLLKEYSVADQKRASARMIYWILSLAKNNFTKENQRWARINKGRGLGSYQATTDNGIETIEFYNKFMDLSEYNDLDTCTITSILAGAYSKRMDKDIGDGKISNDYAKAYFASYKKFMSLPEPAQDVQWVEVAQNSVNNQTLTLVASNVTINYQRMNKLKELDAFLLSKGMLPLFCEDDNQSYRALVMGYMITRRRFSALEKLLLHFAKENGAENLDYIYAMICENLDEKNAAKVRAVVEKVAGKEALFLSMLQLLVAEADAQDAPALFAAALEYTKSTLFVPGHYFRGRLLQQAFRLKMDVDTAFVLLDRSAADYIVQAIQQKDGWRRELCDAMLDWWEAVPPQAPSMQRYLAFHMAGMVLERNDMNRELGAEAYISSFAAYIRRRYAWEKEQLAEGLMEGYGSEQLTAPLRAVCAAQHALNLMEQGKNTEAMRALKVVIEQEPGYKHVVTRMNDKLAQDTQQQLNRLSEMDGLLAGIKPKLQQLIAAGQVAEVKTILAQLEELAPNDPDLLEIKTQLSMMPPS